MPATEGQRKVEPKIATGFVYLMKSGRHYKVGRTNSVGRRGSELTIKIPVPPTTIHSIETDDPVARSGKFKLSFGEDLRSQPRLPRFISWGLHAPHWNTWRDPGGPMALNWKREITAMVLSANEESLIKVVRMLPPDEARKVLVWAQQLADLGGGRRVEWSDSWSDDDLRDATIASLERFEEQEREGR
ncbi:MAG: hypothetical protein SFV54_09750 [Bryobacteraceae bacterium]|nr:hypothetical protein [Bryobacteraceae bacterium]